MIKGKFNRQNDLILYCIENKTKREDSSCVLYWNISFQGRILGGALGGLGPWVTKGVPKKRKGKGKKKRKKEGKKGKKERKR